MIIGKRKREKSQLYRKLSIRMNVSFSFYFFMFLYKIIRLFRIGNPTLVKIIVPKYNTKSIVL